MATHRQFLSDLDPQLMITLFEANPEVIDSTQESDRQGVAKQYQYMKETYPGALEFLNYIVKHVVEGGADEGRIGLISSGAFMMLNGLRLAAEYDEQTSATLADYQLEPDDVDVRPTREHALKAYERLLKERGDDPLLHENAEETRRWMLSGGLPADDPEFISAALIGALTVYRKAEHQAFVEIDQGSGFMSEPTRATGQMASGAIIELGIILEELSGPAQE